MTMTLSEKVRLGIRERAAANEQETGKAADKLLAFALDFEDDPTDPIEAAFLKAVLRTIKIKWDLEEFLEWLGAQMKAADEESADRHPPTLEGALALIQWLQNRSVPKRWKKPIFDHLKSTTGIKVSFPHPSVSLDTFLSSGRW